VSDQGIAIVVGVGPGLGASLARRFAAEGMKVAVTARSEKKTAPIVDEITRDGRGEAVGFNFDTTNEAAVVRFFEEVDARWGGASLVVYNAGAFMKTSIIDASADDFVRCWQANCFGGFLVGREAAARMAPRGSGTILFTGATASKKGSAQFFNLSVGKFGLFALAQAMARELGPQGVHVGHVIIDGQIMSESRAHLAEERAPDGLLAADAIADTYWHLHTQHRSAWALDVDLRPWVENF